MSYLLKLDSKNAAKSDDFEVEYTQPIPAPGSWEIALIRSFVWYSYYNVSAAYGTNIIRYSKNAGSTWETNITIPDGIYSVTDINNVIQAELKLRGDWNSIDETHYITIKPNFNTLRVEVELSNNYQVDFTAGSIRTLLGFDSIIATVSQSATNLADITRGVNSLVINCSLTDAGYQNQFSGNGLYSFLPDSPPGSNIQIIPSEPIYLPVNTQMITRIRVWITDQQNRRVDLSGEDVTYLLHIRKRSST